jgi:hypothetical protein
MVFLSKFIIILLMLSIPWKETRKHQTNLSASKATFAFSKDKRFKDRNSVLYSICHLDAILFTTFHLVWAKRQLPESARAAKFPSLTRQLRTPRL